MCLDIREYVGSSEAEWNEEPGAYVFKSQLSQALSLLCTGEDVRGIAISSDSYSMCVCVAMCALYTANHNINNANL